MTIYKELFMKKIELKSAAKIIGGCNKTTCETTVVQMDDGGCYNRINCIDKNGNIVETRLEQIASSFCSVSS